MTAPLVSIIVPVFNTPEDLLDQCVKSLRFQTYPNIEILFIDDGSEAKIQQHCEKLANTDERIMLFRQSNAGVSSARNLGLKQAQGTFITFVDSDDMLSTHAISRLIKTATTEDADIVVAQLSESPTILNQNELEKTTIFSGKDAVLRLLYGENVPTGPVAKLFRKTLIQNKSFDVSLRFAEDLHFNYFVFRESSLVVIDKTCLYWYRNDNKQSATRSGFHPDRMDGLNSLRAVLRSAREQKSQEIKQAVEYRMFMEALFILISIGSKSRYPQHWEECRRAMSHTQASVIRNSRVKHSDRVLVLLSTLDERIAVFLYSLKRKLRNLIQRFA